MADLWAALSLVVLLEGLFLFATPQVWKEAVVQLLQLSNRKLRAIGGAMVIVGLLALYVIRGGEG
jgi:uncharacterized protein